MKTALFFDENKQLNAMSKILFALTGLDISIILFCYVTLYTNINAYSTNNQFKAILTGVIVLFLLLYAIKFNEIYKIKRKIDEKDKIIESHINREALQLEKSKAVDKYNEIIQLHAQGKYSEITDYCNNHLEMTQYKIEDITDSLCINAIISTYVRKTKSFNMDFDYICPRELDAYNESGGIDSKILNTVLGNLLDNAMEANMTMADKETMVKLEINIEPNQVVYAITNNGPRIDDISKVFKSRFSTKGRGRGMGLVAVIRLLENYNGDIDVESTDQWTKFQIRFNHYN